MWREVTLNLFKSQKKNTWAEVKSSIIYRNLPRRSWEKKVVGKLKVKEK